MRKAVGGDHKGGERMGRKAIFIGAAGAIALGVEIEDGVRLISATLSTRKSGS